MDSRKQTVTATETNGHDPAVTDLSEIIAATRTTRVFRLDVGAIREDTLTPYELTVVGRALDMTPADLSEVVRTHGGWAAVEVAQAFAWIIARRVEPSLTWEQAQTFGLDLVTAPPGPTPAVAKSSRRRGTTGK